MSLEVTVNTLEGEEFKLQCAPSDTVAILKDKIQKEIGKDFRLQTLVWGGRALEISDSTLEELGVENGCKLTMVIDSSFLVGVWRSCGTLFGQLGNGVRQDYEILKINKDCTFLYSNRGCWDSPQDFNDRMMSSNGSGHWELRGGLVLEGSFEINTDDEDPDQVPKEKFEGRKAIPLMSLKADGKLERQMWIKQN